MATLLPDSGITCMSMGNDVLSFAQRYDGHILQFGGEVDPSDGEFMAMSKRDTIVAERRRKGNGNLMPDSPRMFTPIAAVPYIRELDKPMTERYVIYLDENDVLHDQHQVANGDYEHGTLASLNVKCAHYSGLAAVTIRGSLAYFISVFYQDPGEDGAVKVISWNGYYSRWERGNANLRDPPLYGTSITAVAPRPDIIGRSNPAAARENEGQPIYYLQLDDNALGSGQGESEPLPIPLGYESSGKKMVFSPHTSLSAVDDKRNLHLVYKSHSGKIKVVRIDSNGVQGNPEQMCGDLTVAPRSSIAACLAPNTGSNTSIVLYYQGLNSVTRKVQLTARVATRPTTASPDTPWEISSPVKLSA